MVRSAEISQAIAVWKLDWASEGEGLVRWLPPESFLPQHGDIGRIAPTSADEPDFVKENPGFFRLRVRVPPLLLPDVAQLERIGAPHGPSVEVAVGLLRRARKTPYELEAAFAVLGAPGPVPEPVRLEAAYLFAANGKRQAALDVLDGVRRPPRPELEPPPIAPPPPGPGIVSSIDARKIARDAALWLGYRRVQRPPPPPDPLPPSVQAAPAWPPPVEPVAALPSEYAIRRLEWIGQSVGPSEEEAIATLEVARGTSYAKRAVKNALASRAHGPLPERVLARCADMLAELGDREEAVGLLEAPPPPPPAPVPPGIDVDTPLREAEAAARADAAERVMAEDASRLGVPERQARFRAVARAAALTVDAFRALGGREKRDALRDAGWALEGAGERGRAAEVYALGADHAEAARLGVPEKAPPSAGEPRAISALAVIDALDRRGLRIAALEAARAHLVEHPDADVAAFARGVLARLVRGPVVTLAIDGREQRVALGEVVTIGRAGSTITVASPLASRQHLRFYRREGVAVVEDPGSHNGTWLAGARLSAPIPVGAGLDLMIGGEIPCAIRDEGGAVAIELGGERTLAPLGAFVVGGLAIARSPRGEEAVVTLSAAPGVVARLGDEPVEAAIELCRGDVVRVAAGAQGEIRVMG